MNTNVKPDLAGDLNTVAPQQSTPNSANSCIEVEHLTFTYPRSSQPTIKGLNFSISEGEIFGFLGPSGAGKSTTQKILIRLLKGYGGRISVFNQSLDTWKSDYYERIGVGFELPNHYLKLTALENLNYFRSLYRGETENPQQLLERVGLAKDADVMVSQFSKGMKMRLNFIRALLNRPRLLFLDEPTSGLDPVNAKIIQDLIREQQAQGTTVFLTTHNMTVADRLCDRVAFIVDGNIELIDSPKALKLQYGERKVRVEYGENSHLISRDFPLEGLGNNSEFLQILRDRDVQTLHTLETTLDNIFIEVTGRTLV
ncbi:ABC transporter ATP-binding protein [Oxynema sp. CENA135]|uniref:ABC transporter ATP-binding protein n=1 Tax=Oxynema sp. CENA135 TaxID=984206 RepID=UPI00190E23C8|nr:ABC transporter ATP-binding protein [Oxynema sp. CENA135]